MKRNKLADSHVNEKLLFALLFAEKTKEKIIGKVGEMMNGSIIGGADKSKNKS